MSETTLAAQDREPSSSRTAALSFIVVTLLLDSIGIGIIMPVLPGLVVDFTGGDTASASLTFGLLVSVYSLMLFLCSPALGLLSDRFGRRPVILLTLAGAALFNAAAAVAATLWLLFAARIVAGACGANMATAGAYVADITPPEKRAQSFGLVMAAFGFGFMVGPALGGWLAEFGPRTPFWAAAVLSACGVVYGLLVLPESLPAARRRAFVWRQANPLAALARLRRSPALGGLSAAFFLIQLANMSVASTIVLFAQFRLGWSAAEVGLFLGVFGLQMIIMQAGAMRLLSARLGDRRMLLLGLALAPAIYVLYSLVGQGWQMFVILVASAPAMVNLPTLRALISRQVAAEEQGEVQGTLGSLDSLAAIIGPLVMTWAFGYFSAAGAPVFFPGAAFLIAALLAAAALIVALRSLNRR